MVLARVCRPSPVRQPKPRQAPRASSRRQRDADSSSIDAPPSAATASSELLRTTLPAGASVAELKLLLAPLAGVAAGRQRLVFAGRLLPDGEAVGEAIGFCGGSGERVVLLLVAPPDASGDDSDSGAATAQPVDAADEPSGGNDGDDFGAAAAEPPGDDDEDDDTRRGAVAPGPLPSSPCRRLRASPPLLRTQNRFALLAGRVAAADVEDVDAACD
jgi:hypothetical protein